MDEINPLATNLAPLNFCIDCCRYRTKRSPDHHSVSGPANLLFMLANLGKAPGSMWRAQGPISTV